MQFISQLEKETKEIAIQLIEQITKRHLQKNGALVIALTGGLGAGKTIFVQGFAKGLGIKRKITSPTFVIIKKYKLKPSSVFKNFFHIDAYRIKNNKETEVLDLKKIFNEPLNIIIIEWPENIKKFMPKDAIWVEIEYGKKENERIIKIN